MQIMSKTIFILSLLTLLSCSTSSHFKKSDIIYAYSTLPALANGIYDGNLSVGELKNYGNSGLGTFNGLDGEMVVLNGVVHQVYESGKINLPSEETQIPFCTVSFFEADTSIVIENRVNYIELKEYLQAQFESINYPIAFQINGEFDEIVCGGAAKQEFPYTKTLAEAIKNRPTYQSYAIKGTLVGVWLPQFMFGLNLSDFHLHFIADNKQFGGHLISFSSKYLNVQFDYKKGYLCQFPTTKPYATKSIDLKNGYNR